MTWTIHPAASFSAHAAQWAQLNVDTLATPLLHPNFVAPLLAQFGDGKEVLAVHEVAGRIDAMAILSPHGGSKWETFQPSQAPIGMWMHRPQLELGPLLSELMRALPGLPLVIGLTQRDPALEPRPADGSQMSSVDYIETSRVPIVGSFDDYWAARGKNLRTNLKKQRAKLAKEGMTSRLEIIRDPALVAAAIVEYGRLETTGWKSGGGTAVSADNEQGRFYQQMLEAFMRRGEACILRYWFDDRIVAMNLCIEGFGVIIILKTAYDEALGNAYSPAFMMLEETCKGLFDEGKLDAIEFYGRVMDWHRRWTDEIRTMYHLTVYRWPVLRQLHTFVKDRKARRQAAPATTPAALATEPGNSPE